MERLKPERNKIVNEIINIDYCGTTALKLLCSQKTFYFIRPLGKIFTAVASVTRLDDRIDHKLEHYECRSLLADSIQLSLTTGREGEIDAAIIGRPISRMSWFASLLLPTGFWGAPIFLSKYCMLRNIFILLKFFTFPPIYCNIQYWINQYMGVGGIDRAN